MGDHLSLIEPTEELQEQYLAFYKEWKESGEDMIPWVISKDPKDFKAMVEWLQDSKKGTNLKPGWVPDSTFWLINLNRDIIGVVNIRHDLTEKLYQYGGHIGYGIRRSQRQKGYATRLLALSLEKCKVLGLNKVLVCCDEDNIGSEKTILNNGGIRDTDFIEEDGNVVRRYWIELNKQ
ncbi:putative acetyltransferase [Pullulanibacillus pueri]|uniref:Acetyltransferase n=1 Tax=Pullulanibacillus pueri TaxID=1437324 RepID=A0A8J2ZUF7_9BACL|nr:GNAT family N-acetyltransferase [Pullulanibacillus pueri]MBM7681151.1 putative acetyltransferase [Pullulanibacillus pueri]GGH77245.1 acetyltransferase [Pullulanibacillus pueri]